MNHWVGGSVLCSSRVSSRNPPSRFSKQCRISSGLTPCFWASFCCTRSDMYIRTVFFTPVVYIQEQYNVYRIYCRFLKGPSHYVHRTGGPQRGSGPDCQLPTCSRPQWRVTP